MIGRIPRHGRAARPAHRRDAPGARRGRERSGLRARALHRRRPRGDQRRRDRRRRSARFDSLARRSRGRCRPPMAAARRLLRARERCSTRHSRAIAGARVRRRRRSASTATITSARCSGPRETSTSSTSRGSRRGRWRSAATKQSPLKDVAGMLRSFSYAAYAGLFAHTAARPDDLRAARAVGARLGNLDDRRVPARLLRDRWQARCSCRPNPTQRDDLLRLFVLDKALYELNYELNNRPDWVRIPLIGHPRPARPCIGVRHSRLRRRRRAFFGAVAVTRRRAVPQSGRRPPASCAFMLHDGAAAGVHPLARRRRWRASQTWVPRRGGRRSLQPTRSTARAAAGSGVALPARRRARRLGGRRPRRVRVARSRLAPRARSMT